MRVILAALIPLLAVPASAKGRQPIIDMHPHASAAAENGPPPLALCVPVGEHPVRDPGRPWEEIFIAWQKNPPCPDPVWSPPTDQALMEQTIAALKRRNVIGVLSGPAERVQQWRQAAPDRFIPGFQFQFGREKPSPDSLRRLYEKARFAVLAEVTNQYLGIAPGDSRFEPYLAVAEELDNPLGVHIGTG
ncbi:MAG: amidohydrolase family protein [Gemmatimonadales bacterium]